MHNILVPTDFSLEAENATQVAVQLSKKFNSCLNLLHIVEFDEPSTINIDLSREIEWTSISQKLKVKIKSARQALQLSIVLHGIVRHKRNEMKPLIVLGNPLKQIEDNISNIEADLVVMGTRGLWGYSEVLLGSNTEWVMRRALCPVVTIKDVAGEDNFSKILVWWAEDRVNSKFLDTIKLFQLAFNSKVYFIHVMTKGKMQREDMIKRKLKDSLEGYNIPQSEWVSMSHHSVEEGILEFADELEPCTIATTTTKHSVLGRLFTKSFSGDMVNHAKHPVLTQLMS